MSVEQIKKQYPDIYWTIHRRGRKAAKERRYWDGVKEALSALDLGGLTVTEVRGYGRQKGHSTVYRGQEYKIDLLPKMQIETVVADHLVDEVVRAIIQAKTGL